MTRYYAANTVAAVTDFMSSYRALRDHLFTIILEDIRRIYPDVMFVQFNTKEQWVDNTRVLSVNVTRIDGRDVSGDESMKRLNTELDALLYQVPRVIPELFGAIDVGHQQQAITYDGQSNKFYTSTII